MTDLLTDIAHLKTEEQITWRSTYERQATQKPGQDITVHLACQVCFQIQQGRCPVISWIGYRTFQHCSKTTFSSMLKKLFHRKSIMSSR